VTEQDQDLRLEHLVDRALRDLPLRRAPPGLEARVLQELARRAALPWWRRSFTHWPWAARALFLLTCAALSALPFVSGVHPALQLGSPRALNQTLALWNAAIEAVGSLTRAIPTLWLYEAAALAALLYALMFALGAAAYRSLYLEA